MWDLNRIPRKKLRIARFKQNSKKEKKTELQNLNSELWEKPELWDLNLNSELWEKPELWDLNLNSELWEKPELWDLNLNSELWEKPELWDLNRIPRKNSEWQDLNLELWEKTELWDLNSELWDKNHI